MVSALKITTVNGGTWPLWILLGLAGGKWQDIQGISALASDSCEQSQLNAKVLGNVRVTNTFPRAHTQPNSALTRCGRGGGLCPLSSLLSDGEEDLLSPHLIKQIPLQLYMPK